MGQVFAGPPLGTQHTVIGTQLPVGPRRLGPPYEEAYFTQIARLLNSCRHLSPSAEFVGGEYGVQGAFRRYLEGVIVA